MKSQKGSKYLSNLVAKESNTSIAYNSYYSDTKCALSALLLRMMDKNAKPQHWWPAWNLTNSMKKCGNMAEGLFLDRLWKWLSNS